MQFMDQTNKATQSGTKETDNMKSSAVKLEDLELDTIYKDDSGHFFEISYDECADSPRLNDEIVTILTWERDYRSPDDNNDTFEEFAKKHGVDISPEWDRDAAINAVTDAMKKGGWYAVPVYALYHGVSHYSIDDFHDQWDSGVVGIAFCQRQKGLPDNDNFLRMIIDQAVQRYDAWVNGEIYEIVSLNQNEKVLYRSGEYMMLDGNRAGMLEDMLSSVRIDIQDEYQPAVREVTVSLK